MPSVREMRGQLYTAIVSGSTGIIYFAMDSYVTRAGDVFGFGPQALLNESYFDSSATAPKPLASPSLLTLAAQLWEGTAKLNTELLSITPVIFAPTSKKSRCAHPSVRGPTMRVELIGHFKPCMTDIYLHIDARMADYIHTHPYGVPVAWACYAPIPSRPIPP